MTKAATESATTSRPATTPAGATPGAPGAGRTMRALVKAKGGPGLEFDGARPLPKGSTGVVGEPGPGEVLIRVTHAGICGTDRHIWEWDEWAQKRIPVGIVTGHEFVGTVAKVGAGVANAQVGQRVCAEGHITAWQDYNARTGCAHIASDTKVIGIDRDGCFADYLMMPAVNLWHVNEKVPSLVAAIMDPLGNAVHTVMTAGVSAKSVLITGVGIIGLMAVTVARAAGAARIFAVDIDPRRLELAKKLGADEVYNSRDGEAWIETVRKATRGDGADVLLEMSGAPPAVDAGFRALRNGGVASMLGTPAKAMMFDLARNVIFKGATVHGISGRRMFETWYQMDDLLATGKLNLEAIITHELPLEDFAKGFEAMRTGEAIKVVLRVA